MQDYYQYRKGRSLRKYCKDEAVDYDWLFGDYIEDILTRLMEGEQDFMSLIPCDYNSNER